MIMAHVRQDGNILVGSGHSIHSSIFLLIPRLRDSRLQTLDWGESCNTEMGVSTDAGAGPARSYNNKTEAKTA